MMMKEKKSFTRILTLQASCRVSEKLTLNTHKHQTSTSIIRVNQSFSFALSHSLSHFALTTFHIIMSLFWNSIDGVHLERVNAEQMAKRGIFVNVKPANDNRNGGGEFGYQARSAIGGGDGGGFFHLENENNLNSSPNRKRDAFTKTPIKKVFSMLTCHTVSEVQIE